MGFASGGFPAEECISQSKMHRLKAQRTSMVECAYILTVLLLRLGNSANLSFSYGNLCLPTEVLQLRPQ